MVKRPDGWLEIAADMNQLKSRLARAGLFRTMHKMDEATRLLGWEVAGDLEGYERYERERLATERIALNGPALAEVAEEREALCTLPPSRLTKLD